MPNPHGHAGFMRLLRLVAGAVMLCLAAGSAKADPATEHWAIKMLAKADQAHQPGLINFDDACRAPALKKGEAAAKAHPWPNLDQNVTPRWAAKCRTITGSELLDLLLHFNLDQNITIAGAYIANADPKQPIDQLKNRDFQVRLTIENSAFASRFSIDNSSFRSLAITNSYFASAFNLENVNIGDFLSFQNLELDGTLDLLSAKTASFFYLSDIACRKCEIAAHNLDVGGNLYIRNQIAAQKLDLSFSNFRRSMIFSIVNVGHDVGGYPVYTQAADDQAVDCFACAVNGSLMFGDFEDAAHTASVFHSLVIFRDARIDGVVELDDVEFHSFLSLDRSTIGNLLIDRGAEIGGLLVRSAAISGSVILSEQDKLERCSAGDPACTPQKDVKIWELLLKGTSIGKTLDLTGLAGGTWQQFDPDPKAAFPVPILDLTGVTANSFSLCRDSSPAYLKIDGFSYNEFYAEEAGYFREEPLCKRFSDDDQPDGGWLNWLWLSPKANKREGAPFDPQPFIFQANLLANEGHYDWSNDILARARWNEMVDHLTCGLTQLNIGVLVNGLWLFALWLITAFGIGLTALVHLLIVIGVTVWIGFRKLWPTARERHYNRIWCIGACLERLLPIIELNQDFKDFFDKKDKHGPNLSDGQKIFFSIYSLWGWFLGFLLLAVMTGLTQGK